eukprot:TRINITY_DN56684_c0_g1_i1.p1 TRINITY_DN56684_c0_g1~~TRINITY_DN56684_c0_g1_i1.p1  ORF type:complete len:204 (-),score=3.14 TRINITY_DN56684_c0_g1_i1:215-826(-)
MTGRNNRRRGGANAAVQLERFKREVHGHKNRLRRLAPPMINHRPFNTLCVHFPMVASAVGQDFQVDVDVLTKRLLNQLGLATQDASVVVFKLQRLDAYATAMPDETYNDRPSINVEISSLIPAVGDPTTPGNAIVHYPVLKRLADQGNVSDSAKISYTWPIHMRDTPITNQSNFTIVQIGINVKTADAYFHVHWSTLDVNTPV